MSPRRLHGMLAAIGSILLLLQSYTDVNWIQNSFWPSCSGIGVETAAAAAAAAAVVR